MVSYDEDKEWLEGELWRIIRTYGAAVSLRSLLMVTVPHNNSLREHKYKEVRPSWAKRSSAMRRLMTKEVVRNLIKLNRLETVDREVFSEFATLREVSVLETLSRVSDGVKRSL